ncbi:MAG: hypothetical protein ACXVWZ_02635 [Nocardioides sp.]
MNDTFAPAEQPATLTPPMPRDPLDDSQRLVASLEAALASGSVSA